MRSYTFRCRVAVVVVMLVVWAWPSGVRAQSWTAPRTWTTGELVTAAIMNSAIRDNLTILRAGGLAVTSQAIGDLLCASSTTQFARVAAGAAGSYLRGSGGCPVYSTLILPNAATANRIVYATGANTWGESANFTFDGTAFTVSSLGSHLFSATGVGGNILSVRNTTAGTGNYAQLSAGTDVSGNQIEILAFSSTYSGDWGNAASSSRIDTGNSGGLTIAATHASGEIRFYTGGTTVAGGITQYGGWWMPSGNKFYFDGGSETYINEVLADQLEIRAGSIAEINLYAVAASTALVLGSGENTSGAVTGPRLVVNNNTGGNGSAGLLSLNRRTSVAQYLWVDATANLRISTSPPEEDGTPSDTSGTVVGDQTSSLDAKFLGAEFLDFNGALAELLRTPLWNFTYRSGSYGGQEFVGIVTDYSPFFGKDRDADHPGGKSLNEVTLHAYEIAAIKALAARSDKAVKELNTRIAALEGQR